MYVESQTTIFIPTLLFLMPLYAVETSAIDYGSVCLFVFFHVPFFFLLFLPGGEPCGHCSLFMCSPGTQVPFWTVLWFPVHSALLRGLLASSVGPPSPLSIPSGLMAVALLWLSMFHLLWSDDRHLVVSTANVL